MKQDEDHRDRGAGNSRLGRRFFQNVRDKVDSVNQELQSNETLSQARETVRQGLDNAAEVASEKAPGLVEEVQRTGDVLTGADLRKFDDFTEAVTRVCVGLHRENVELRSQLERLEQQLEESILAQKDLAARLEALEEGKD
ncbi:MAG: hypothetical protein OXE17_00165 [Chloroflexi bacterium]|nr:hypothetical protein [Chloroflexota bacterium]